MCEDVCARARLQLHIYAEYILLAKPWRTSAGAGKLGCSLRCGAFIKTAEDFETVSQ